MEYHPDLCAYGCCGGVGICRARDSDGSGEAGQTAKQAGPKATARAEGIAQTPTPKAPS